ncbi:MAG: HlyD family secretion protein [Sphingobacterium sp.]|uniref:HlyD family secretion protein n=1 Tax=Sphingobacterium sp. JB170 TaxID=1434842 RepID=UPI00097E9F56|nr:HlyD family secretion protein [Sphingobacterium sp. JB170]SJN49318.1 Membrane fusion component of tripartite multidrug resistance system [Sphingobacterium sp. JB170]
MSNGQLQKRKAGKNNRRITITNFLIFLVVALALLWILKSYLHIGDKGYVNDAQVEAFINPINSRVSSYITEIRYTEHQRVKKGDTLVILDDREIQTQLGQAEAAYMNALASKKVSSSSISTLKNNVEVANANIAGANARLWNAEQNYKRYESLLADEAVTRQQFEQIKTEYDAQKAAYESLISQRGTSYLTVNEAISKVEVNDAEIKRTSSALEMARLTLSYTVITAPYDGVMGRRIINEGQLLQSGQQVATIVTENSKWITANYREKQLSQISIGKKVDIKVDALDGKGYEGVVTAISEATGAKYSAVPLDNSTGNFVKVQQRIPVRIEFTSTNSKTSLDSLRAGMNVELRFK